MDERMDRPEGTAEVGTAYEPNVDIRRTTMMGRDYETGAPPRVLGVAPTNRVLHWGPIWAGLVTALVVSVLLEALFVGLGFTGRRPGVGFGYGPATTWSTVLASFLGVFVGGYLAGYCSDVRTHTESLFNGFVVGAMTIIAPLLVAIIGGLTAAGAAAGRAVPTGAQIQGALTIAANNAWAVFVGGAIVLILGVLGAYAGVMARERALVSVARKDLHLPHLSRR